MTIQSVDNGDHPASKPARNQERCRYPKEGKDTQNAVPPTPEEINQARSTGGHSRLVEDNTENCIGQDRAGGIRPEAEETSVFFQEQHQDSGTQEGTQGTQEDARDIENQSPAQDQTIGEIMEPTTVHRPSTNTPQDNMPPRLEEIPLHASLYEPRRREIVEGHVICVEGRVGSESKKILLLFGFVFVALCVGLGLGLTRPFQPQPEPSLPPNSADAPVDPEQVIQLLDSVIDRAKLENATSPEFKAFQWLVYEDENKVLRESLAVQDAVSSSWKIAQRYILALFYFATGGDTSWPRKMGFLSPNDLCDWNEIADITLPSLQYVPEINHFVYLGDEPVKLQGISCNTEGRITTITMQANLVTGRIPNAIGSLSSLEELRLSYNRLTGINAKELSMLPHLVQLDLGFNELTGEIPTELGSLSNLEFISFDFNFRMNGTLPTELGLWTNLEKANFRYIGLSGSIPKFVEKGTNLRFVDFSLNYVLTGTIPTELGNWRNVEHVNFDFNQLTGTIPIELGYWSNVETVRFNYNQLTGTIPTELGSWSNVVDAWFAENQLSGTIPTELGYWRNVEDIDFEDNQLTGIIPTELGYWSNLNVGFFDNNQLTGTIPTELGYWSNVKRVGFEYNQLTGTIPTELGNWSNVTHAWFGANQLTGTIPTELGYWSNIEAVYFYENQLSGTIPSELGYWSNVYFAYFDNNQLTGTIPSEIGGFNSDCTGFYFWNNLLYTSFVDYLPDP